MSLSITLTPEEEERVRALAARRGLDPEEYARQLLRESLPSAEEGPETLTDEEFDALLDSLSDGMDPAGLPLADEATHRASFYGDRG